MSGVENPQFKVSHRWSFGDNEAAGNLVKLVLSGQKTAATGLYREGQIIPKKGEYAEILDSNNKSVCIIQYTDVVIKPFLEVDYEYVLKEGESDKNLDEWREKHRIFFPELSDDTLVVCEEFFLKSFAIYPTIV